MKNLILISLEMQNFQGIKTRKVDFDRTQTIIKGKNESGKTTVVDSLLWLLVDIDSKGKTGTGKGSSIKPFDSEFNTIHNLETSVKGEFELDGQKILLKKTLKEVWSEDDYKNVTIYEIDNIELKKTDFDKYLSSIIDPAILKLMLYPDSFFSLTTAEKRKIITSLADIKVERSVWLENQLKSKDLITLKKSLLASVKNAKENIANTSSRLNEVKGMIKTVDFASNETIIKGFETEILGYQKELESIAAAEKAANSNFKTVQQRIQSLTKEKFQLQSKIQQIENDFTTRKTKRLHELQSIIDQLTRESLNYGHTILESKTQIENFVNRKAEIKENAMKLRVLQFDENQTICPTCKQGLPEREIHNLIESFNLNKVSNFEELKALSITMSEKIKKLEEYIISLNEMIAQNNDKIKGAKDEIEKVNKHTLQNFTDKTRKALLLEVQNIEIAIVKLEEMPVEIKDNSELHLLISGVKEKLTPLYEVRGIEKTNKEYAARIEILQADIVNEQNKISELTMQIKEVEEYTNRVLKATDKQVNDNFIFIRVFMFETLLNGNINDICEVTIKGVPYIAANNGAKPSAKLDIVNALSRKHKIKVPCFIDNMESTGSLIDTELQLIKLYHVENAEFSVSKDSN